MYLAAPIGHCPTSLERQHRSDDGFAFGANGPFTDSRATGSDLYRGIWVQSSENVLVTHSVAEGNVNGFEISNSDDVEVVHNATRRNTVGMSILMLPGSGFDERQGANRINLRDNLVVDNNRQNTARPRLGTSSPTITTSGIRNRLTT